MSLSYVKIYKDFIDIARALDNGARGRLFLAILEYINGVETVHLTGAEQIAFLSIKGQIDRDEASLEAVSQTRSEAGKKGAAKRWGNTENMANAIFGNSKDGKHGNNKDEDKDKDKDNIERGAAPRFSRPSLEDVAAYCRERSNTVDPQRFVDYYTANGWRAGKQPMKDWRAAVRTWEGREKKSASRAEDIFAEVNGL